MSHAPAAAVRPVRGPRNRSAHLLAYSQDPQVLCLAWLAHVRFCQGETAVARQLRDRALAAARTVGHPFTLAAALLDLDLADLPSLRDRVAALIDLRGRVEAPSWRGLSRGRLNGSAGAPA